MDKKKDKEYLTNEHLRSKFTSQFDLVAYAIKLAESMIKTGREARVYTDTQNPAMQILAEIGTGKDRLEDIQEPDLELDEEIEIEEISFINTKEPPVKPERRKSRILQ